MYHVRNAHQSPAFTITISPDNSFIASAAGKQLRITQLPKSISKGKSVQSESLFSTHTHLIVFVFLSFRRV